MGRYHKSVSFSFCKWMYYQLMHSEHLPCAGRLGFTSSEGGLSFPILQMKSSKTEAVPASAELGWRRDAWTLSSGSAETSQSQGARRLDLGSLVSFQHTSIPCPCEIKPLKWTVSPNSHGLVSGSWRLNWPSLGNVGRAEPLPGGSWGHAWPASGHMPLPAFHCE